MSSAATTSAATNPPPAGTVTSQATVPEGIRLVLTLPPGLAISGKLTLDWVRPSLIGDKS